MNLLLAAFALTALPLKGSGTQVDPPPASPVPSGKQDKVELRWKWQKDQELIYKSSQETLMELSGHPMRQQLRYTYSMTVSEVGPGDEATILVKYLAVASKVSGPQGDFDFDSERDKAAPLEGPGAMQARMVGQSFTMKMSPTGRVLDVRGYDKVLETMLKGAPEEDPALRVQLRQMFSNESFKGMMQQMAPPLPVQKVGPGDRWENDFSVKMPMIGAMRFSLKSRFTELKDNNAIIDQEILAEPIDREKDSPLTGLVEIRGGIGKATLVYSIDQGCFVSQKSTMEMKMSVQGNDMPMSTVVELRLVSRK